jgi:hypothetical protein
MYFSNAKTKNMNYDQTVLNNNLYVAVRPYVTVLEDSVLNEELRNLVRTLRSVMSRDSILYMRRHFHGTSLGKKFISVFKHVIDTSRTPIEGTAHMCCFLRYTLNTVTLLNLSKQDKCRVLQRAHRFLASIADTYFPDVNPSTLSGTVTVIIEADFVKSMRVLHDLETNCGLGGLGQPNWRADNDLNPFSVHVVERFQNFIQQSSTLDESMNCIAGLLLYLHVCLKFVRIPKRTCKKIRTFIERSVRRHRRFESSDDIEEFVRDYMYSFADCTVPPESPLFSSLKPRTVDKVIQSEDMFNRNFGREVLFPWVEKSRTEYEYMHRAIVLMQYVFAMHAYTSPTQYVRITLDFLNEQGAKRIVSSSYDNTRKVYQDYLENLSQLVHTEN